MLPSLCFHRGREAEENIVADRNTCSKNLAASFRPASALPATEQRFLASEYLGAAAHTPRYSE